MKIFNISLIIFIFINKYNIFTQLHKTFTYAGLRLNIGSTCIFLMFLLLPSELFKNKIIKKIIIQLTNYTGGIYFIHYLIGKGYLCRNITFIKKGTLFGCIIIYKICYLISFIGTKILGNTKLKHLFI